MNPLSIATKGKGIAGTAKRANAIRTRYGVTLFLMDRQISHFVQILEKFGGTATFPITATVLARAKGYARKYQDRKIEFALHGYTHVDHTNLTLGEQFDYALKALKIFNDEGLVCSGFRCPYLRWNEDTLAAIRRAGFLYDSSQGVAWDVVDEVNTEAYERVLEFYDAKPVDGFPALPYLENGLVRIPYCLPDDEALVERFHIQDPELMFQLWSAILAESYNSGELFTLGLHPERLAECATPLLKILQAARQLSPPVWFARLDEIAHWWKERTESNVTVERLNDRDYEISVAGPKGVTILARNLDVITPTVAWDSQYQRSPSTILRFQADHRPFIGLSPSSSPRLASFLRQQGYITELVADGQKYTYYLDRPNFERQDQRSLLEELERRNFPLVRLGKWPDGARSALSITGDIDALTIWDYSLRLFGR